MSSHDSRLQMLANAAAFVTIVGLCASPARASAADLDSPFFENQPQPQMQPQMQPVEFGTGWYLRGDLAYARDTLPNIDEAGLFVSPSATQNSFSADLGAGYRFNKWFRTDVTLDYRQPLSAYDPTTTTNANGGRWDALVNGYVDLGTWYGVTPYVGAGAGAAWGMTRITSADAAFSCTQGGSIQCYEDHIPTSFAWALMAGFAFQIFPHAFIDVGYRYLNLGTYSFYDSSLWPALSAPGLLPAAQSQVQEIRIGFRYMID